jgi:hypothetical protein
MSSNKVNDKTAHDAERAFIRLAPQREALKPNDVVKPNLDLARSVGVVLAAEPAIAALIPEMENLPGFDLKPVRQLRDIALAAGYANAVFAPPSTGASVKQLVAEAKAVRRTLIPQAEALAAMGVIRQEKVEAIGSARTQRSLANSLIALAKLYREHQSAIRQAAPAIGPTVDEAARIGMALIERLGIREYAPLAGSEAAKAADTRARAYTLLVRAYEQAQRAVMYLRWSEGDAETIAPSLYPLRGPRRSRVEPSQPVTTAPAAPAAPANPPVV